MAETAYGFNTRFGDKKGTNPEDLIAAAHAACFTMALSNALAQAGHAPHAVDTRADVALSLDGGPPLPPILPPTNAKVPGSDDQNFLDHAAASRQHSPDISKAK